MQSEAAAPTGHQTLTWKEVCKASAAAGFFHGVMGAEENAHTTIYEEKAAPEADHERLCMATLEEYLAYGTLDKAEHDFFVKLGVGF